MYTNATLALDPDTGKRIWFYQHMERDVWDFDWAFERYAFTMKAADGPRRVVGTVGKLGILDVLDAKTGAYVASFDMGMQDLVTAIDPKTGQKTTNPAAEPQDGVFKHICPFAGGVRNWPATSFDGSQGVLYVPFTRSCMNYAFHGDRTLDISYAMAPPVQGNGMLGGVMAIDMQSLKPLWVQEQRAAASSGVLATDGGVVFAGDRDRWFRALDSSNGKVLWQTRLDRRLSSNPITFAHGNNQYVAIVSGGGAPNDATQESLNPEISKNCAWSDALGIPK
ncbi:PQQ-binding-like beta-propeller repeat protein [Novosphingobium colocasiae]